MHHPCRTGASSWLVDFLGEFLVRASNGRDIQHNPVKVQPQTSRQPGFRFAPDVRKGASDFEAKSPLWGWARHT
jgi:hypothetical protein